MKIQLKQNNRLTLPKEVIEGLKLHPGDELLVEMRDGELVLIPAETVPRDEAYLFTPYWQQALAEAYEDIAAGRIKSAPSAAEMLRQIRGK